MIVSMRASSVGGLFDCAYKWQGEQLLGMRRPAAIRTWLGTAIHAGTGAFDQAKVEHKPISVSDAADVFIEKLHNPTEEVDYKIDRSINMREAEAIGLTLHTRYCNEISPLYTFKAVEMQLKPMDIDCGNGITIRLTGTMDRARVAVLADQTTLEVKRIPNGYAGEWVPVAPSGIIIPDVKSGSRLIENGQVIIKGRSAQLGTYQLIYEDNTGEATAGAQIIALPTSGKPIPAVSKIWDARRVMIGTNEAPGFIELAAKMFKDGFFPPNPQSPLCSEKYCARWNTCAYHD